MGEIGEHWRDVNAHRKRERDQQREQDKYLADAKAENTPRCWDWMLVSGTTHYARDRASFKTYNPATGTASGIAVAGIGSVELKVVKSPSSNATTTITLENVLHIPTAICNGINTRVACSSQSFGEPSQAYDDNQQPLFYGTRFCGLSRLVLDGAPQGLSALQEANDGGDTAFMLSVYVSPEELNRILEQRI